MELNQENTKAYELRSLTAEDVFPMFQIISKIGIKEFKTCFDSPEVAKAMQSVATGSNPENINSIGLIVAVDLASVILSNLPKCKTDIYLFLAQLSGMSKEEIAGLPMMTFMEMIVDVFKKEEFRDFFQVVSKLLK